ncbi:Glyoxalase/Bleomycin resistance protein/Dihydroxybiphenyl dioxygenase [Glomus cerebriforme]|uniref:Methylmalonyl-CoA epimerase, mitochondrial n=1 Tax=Glomus cerebriforme TaxID=658196 RepID=A0A397TFR8_9GLOM|nr:Glyoxalase/Bleomycin resistance protein/Dihydroxybiphenyl dioxygenase [Glomus cerebriforme]
MSYLLKNIFSKNNILNSTLLSRTLNTKNIGVFSKFINNNYIYLERNQNRSFSSVSFVAGANTTNTVGISNDHPLWKLGHLNHVAIAVPNLDNAVNFYKNILGVEQVSEAVPQPEHGVYTVFVNLGNTKIELLHPYGEKSPIHNFLEKNKNGGIHHICIEVNNVSKAVKDLLGKGIRPLDPEPKIGAHGNPVVFLHPKDCGGVLVELEQVE